MLEHHSTSGEVALAADLALHHERGGDDVGAAAWYLAAAESAERVYAHDEAIQFATRAIDLTTEDADVCGLVRPRNCDQDEVDGTPQRRDIDEAMSIAAPIGDDDLTWQLLMCRVHLERSLGKRNQEGAVISELEVTSEKCVE